MTGMELKIERIKARIPQHKVAARLGICATTLSAVENGRKPVKEEFAKKVLAVIEEFKEEHARRVCARR